MTFLAPGFLYASLAVAAAIVALHFIVTRQPRAGILPTARFVPHTRATTVAPARQPSDFVLMLVRVLLVLAAGAGLARPILTPRRGAEARVILVDVSRSSTDSLAMRDSVRAMYRDRDAVVLFDSSARLVTRNVTDTLAALKPTIRRGSLSAALIAALRAGSALRDRDDSLELVIVSPFAREEFDAATDTIRKLWSGKAKLVRIASPGVDTVSPQHELTITTSGDDPLAVTVGLARTTPTANGRIERISSAALSPGVRSGGALIDWPDSTRPRFAVQRDVRDMVGGVMASDAVVVATFNRRWSYPPDSLRGADVIARWVDGEPAAVEKPDATSCVRSVAIPVTPIGDFVIRHDFVRLVAALSRPCARITSLIPTDPSDIAQLEGKGGFAPRASFQPLTDAHSDLAPWLFALALAAAIAEPFVRRRGRDTRSLAGTGGVSTGDEARAA
ncbi:MAG: BatA domain-containing protein [Thermoanaerobaculia bacterium]